MSLRDLFPGKIIHVLKIHPKHFQDIFIRKVKFFEIRKDDRCYRKGDYLLLREWCNNHHEFTGNYDIVFVPFIHKGLGMKSGYICMSIYETKFDKETKEKILREMID